MTELARPLSMWLPGVMQHLVVLERCGVVTSTKRGRVRTCSLEPLSLVPVEHDTIVVERRFAAPPHRVFAAWVEPEGRDRWDVPGDG